ncbi:MAG: FKBP-type peptidyl-prolyl cis-trans isomerase [Candidatus Levybacteria bacterium]|nr:FKBP-type peptidyl-prolyl cis-trans isomerase [Candidatus Levybacteria bacterium]
MYDIIGSMKRIGISLGALLAIYVLAVVIINSTGKKTVTTTPDQTTSQTTKVTKKDLIVGTGTEAKTGDTVSVNYKGTLTNGKQFDSSYDRKEPFTFTLGKGEVIKGWDDGVVGMKIGGKRKLTIPPELGYGTNAQGDIPANSTLVFEVELLTVKSSGDSAPIDPAINL